MTTGPATAQLAPRGWRFEEFEVDAQRNILRRAGTRVPVTPKAIETLILLLRNQGRTVSKSELLEAVWSGSVVEENTIAVAIAALRRALGDRPRDARFVITVPGSGYRFVADVAPLHAESPTETPMRLQPVPQFSDLWSISRRVPERADWHVPFDPAAEVAGKTLAEWLTTWWTHAMERPGEGHPFLMASADQGAATVVDGVAFLFKSFIATSTVERRCTLPPGIPVLVPVRLYNIDNVGLPADEQLQEPEMLSLLRRMIDDLEDLTLDVDGTSIPDLRRFRTGPQRFTYRPGPDSVYARLNLHPPEVVEPAFCDGYLAILPPPPPGEHVVHFGGTGRVNGERVTREAIYHLSVPA